MPVYLVRAACSAQCACKTCRFYLKSPRQSVPCVNSCAKSCAYSLRTSPYDFARVAAASRSGLRQLLHAYAITCQHTRQRGGTAKITVMTPDEYCQQKAAPRGSSFYYSVLFQDLSRRRALTALHALRRELAGVVHAPSDENAARIKLAWWRHELGEMFSGNPQHLVTRALAPGLEPYRISHQHLDQVVDGMEMDLLQARYLDFAALARYCSLASGAFEQCVAGILCPDGDAAPDYAHHLGMALALTRMIRNAGDDARRGRVYLPVNELQQFNVPVADILNARHSDHFHQLMQFQWERADTHYDQALAALRHSQRKAQRVGLITAAIHRTLLNEIRADGFQVLRQRTRWQSRWRNSASCGQR